MFVWEVGGGWDGERKEQRVEGLSWGRECRGSGRDTGERTFLRERTGWFIRTGVQLQFLSPRERSIICDKDMPVYSCCRKRALCSTHTLLPLRWNFESVISRCRFLSFLVEPALDATTLEKTPLQEETFVSLQGLLPAGGSQHHLQCVDFNKGARHPVQFFNVKEWPKMHWLHILASATYLSALWTKPSGKHRHQQR